MAKIHLLPTPLLARNHVEKLIPYLSTNFRRIVDAVQRVPVVVSGNDEVTGTLIVDTGLDSLSLAVASLDEVPAATGAFARAVVVNGNQVTLTVYNSDFTVSSTQKTVNWIAFGE